MTFSFGREFRIHVFGESHGECIGVVVEGVSPGLNIDLSEIQREMDRRRPGTSTLTTSRSEEDIVNIQSGVFNGKATGAPLTMTVNNEDVDSSAYEEIRNTPRPGHADYTARIKYKGFNDYRGGGFFSGRMTAAFVMAGSLAKQILRNHDIEITARIIKIGGSDEQEEMQREISKAKEEGDSVGGIVECQVNGIPVGLGEPIFDSVESIISHAMFSIPGVKGIEFGSGFEGSSKQGSENNDTPSISNGAIHWSKNDAGGVLGGITNGAPIVFRIAIKPTSSIGKEQNTVDLEKMTETTMQIRGRHDPCIVPRAVPVVEAMTSIVVLDFLMRWESSSI